MCITLVRLYCSIYCCTSALQYCTAPYTAVLQHCNIVLLHILLYFSTTILYCSIYCCTLALQYCTAPYTAVLQHYNIVLLHILLYFSTAILYCCTYKDYSIAVLQFLEAAMLWCVCKSCDISAGVLAAVLLNNARGRFCLRKVPATEMAEGRVSELLPVAAAAREEEGDHTPSPWGSGKARAKGVPALQGESREGHRPLHSRQGENTATDSGGGTER